MVVKLVSLKRESVSKSLRTTVLDCQHKVSVVKLGIILSNHMIVHIKHRFACESLNKSLLLKNCTFT